MTLFGNSAFAPLFKYSPISRRREASVTRRKPRLLSRVAAST
jgi:hypothetical protein